MSIANLYAQSTHKDQNIFCDSITADTFTVDNLITEDLTVNNDAFIGNDLTIDNDLDVTNNITARDITAGNNLTVVVDLAVNNNMTVAGNLVVDDNITSTNGDIFASQSVNIGSVGRILVAQGDHDWTTGQDPGVNVLTISGLDGNAHQGYEIIFSFIGEPTGSQNKISMRINGITSNVYSSRITQNTSGLNSDGTDFWDFIFTNSTTDRTGNGHYTMWADNQLVLKSMCGNMSSVNPNNPSNGCQVYKTAYTMNNSSNITSFEFDVSNNAHNGWELSYRIYRLA